MYADHNLVRPELNGDTFYLEGGSTLVLLFHGFTATTAEVRLLANELNVNGYSTAGPLLPGHGTKPTDLNRVTWRTWVNSAELFYAKFQNQFQNIIVGGESMGALIALWLATYHPEIRGLLLYSPALNVPDLRWVEWASIFKPEIPKKNLDDDMAWQGYPVYPLKGAAQLRRFQRAVLKRLPLIDQPVRIFQGRLDTTIAPECGQTILDQIHSVRKDLLWFEQSSHCIILDSEKEDVFKSSLQFLQTCV